jgi:hypothetical protein
MMKRIEAFHKQWKYCMVGEEPDRQLDKRRFYTYGLGFLQILMTSQKPFLWSGRKTFLQYCETVYSQRSAFFYASFVNDCMRLFICDDVDVSTNPHHL